MTNGLQDCTILLLLLLLLLLSLKVSIVIAQLDKSETTPVHLYCSNNIDASGEIPSSKKAFILRDFQQSLFNNICDADPLPDSNTYILCSKACENCPDRLLQLSPNILIISNEQPIPNLSAIWLTTKTPISDIHGNCSINWTEPSIQFDKGSESPNSNSDTGSNSDSNGESLKNFSKTSVLFVSISFIILMVISLAWLVFYYVQRFRYAHAKDRLQRRLFNAARKALTRIPTRMLKAGDAELETDCAVCIDPYQTHDVVRTLPCKHVYHKSCIDPWLLEHRTCPMCKADILKYFGFHYNDGLSSRQEDAIQGERGERGEDMEIPSNSLSPSNSFPMATDNASAIENEHLHQIIVQSTAAASAPQKGIMSAQGNRPITAGNIIIHERPRTSSASTSTSDDRQLRHTREIHSASAVHPRNLVSREARGSQGQIVNLVQVKTRAMGLTRAATLRKDSQPTPIDANSSNSSGSAETI